MLALWVLHGATIWSLAVRNVREKNGRKCLDNRGLWYVVIGCICHHMPVFQSHFNQPHQPEIFYPRQQPWRPSLPSWSPASPHEICGFNPPDPVETLPLLPSTLEALTNANLWRFRIQLVDIRVDLNLKAWLSENCLQRCISWWFKIVIETVIQHKAMMGHRGILYTPCKTSWHQTNFIETASSNIQQQLGSTPTGARSKCAGRYSGKALGVGPSRSLTGRLGGLMNHGCGSKERVAMDL